MHTAYIWKVLLYTMHSIWLWRLACIHLIWNSVVLMKLLLRKMPGLNRPGYSYRWMIWFHIIMFCWPYLVGQWIIGYLVINQINLTFILCNCWIALIVIILICSGSRWFELHASDIVNPVQFVIQIVNVQHVTRILHISLYYSPERGVAVGPHGDVGLWGREESRGSDGRCAERIVRDQCQLPGPAQGKHNIDKKRCIGISSIRWTLKWIVAHFILSSQMYFFL